MTQARVTFRDELIELQSLVLDLAEKVKANGELLLEYFKKHDVSELFFKIKNKDKEIDNARWQVHDYGDKLIVLQQPVAKDFRQIITSIQITDNLERIGDHYKKIARFLEKVSFPDIGMPEEIVDMARLSVQMLGEAIQAYSVLFDGRVNKIAEEDDRVDSIYRSAIKKIINMIKSSPEEKVDSISKLFFIAQSFERASDHAAKIGQLVNFAITGERKN
ncbi:MAG: phosphate signaling complex protein PhoU [Candidatus Melainabacteria bacterium]|nr:phosphate signaling complex protein PhoU [Candidatus Melainabacteria bacterium]